MRQTIYGNKILEKPPVLKRALVEPVITLSEDFVIDDEILRKHLAIIGATRSGKTVILKKMMDSALKYQDKTGDNAVIFCAKKDLLKYRREGDILISVDSQDPESCWNIFIEMKMSEHPELLVREISEALFEEHKSTLQPFYYFAPKQIFEQAVLFLYHLQEDCGFEMDNKLLYDFLIGRELGTRDSQGKKNEEDIAVNPWNLTWFELADYFPEYFSCINELFGHEGMIEAYSILAEISIMVTSHFYGSFCMQGGKFSALEILHGKGKRILLYYDYMNAKSCRGIFRIILDLLLQQAMAAENLENTNRHYFWLEECSQIPALKNLLDSLSFGAEFGVRVILVLQSCMLLNKVYSETETKTIFSLLSNVILLQTSDSFTREWAMKNRFGKGYFLIEGTNSGMKEVEEMVEDDIVSDAILSGLVMPGDALVAMPGISASPFYFRSYKID